MFYPGAYGLFSGGRAYTAFRQGIEAVRNGRDAGEFVVDLAAYISVNLEAAGRIITAGAASDNTTDDELREFLDTAIPERN